MTAEHGAALGLSDLEIELADDRQVPALRPRRQVPDARPPEPEPSGQRIVEILAAAGAPLSQRQIRERAVTRAATVAAALQTLIHERRVEHASEGGYRIGPAGATGATSTPANPRHRQDLFPETFSASNPREGGRKRETPAAHLPSRQNVTGI